MTKDATNKLKKDIVKKFKLAVRNLYDKDGYLINYMGGVAQSLQQKKPDDGHHVGERAIAYKIAHYLENILSLDPQYKEYDVDFEYNRDIIDIKRIVLDIVIPDIIVHKRGGYDGDLLVAEIKSYWNRDVGDDIKKLKGFTGDEENYRYSVGLSVVIEQKEKDVKYIIVEKGEDPKNKKE